MLLKRESELDRTAAALRDAQAGSGSLLVITGPFGIGRSALLDAAAGLGTAQGALVLRANTALTERGYDLGVARQLLEPALRRVAAEASRDWTAGDARHALPALDNPLADGGDTAHSDPDGSVLVGLLALIENMSHDRVLLLLVDDLHWADPASLRLLGRLAGQLRRLRVVLVCTVREGDALSEHRLVREVTAHASRTLRPAALDLGDTETLIRDRLGRAPDEDFVLACHQASRGIPVFLAAVLAQADPREPHPRNPLLRRRVLLCVEWQPEEVGLVARALAVLAGQVGPVLVGRAAGVDDVEREEALRRLRRLGLLTEDQLPRFVHPVVREVLEEAVPAAERDRLHAAAASLLHFGGHPAEEVAAQLLAITTKQGAWAVETLRAAADAALRRGAPRTAARYLRRALLDCPSYDVDRARLLVDLATAERDFSALASVRHVFDAVPLLESARERAAATAELGSTALSLSPLPVGELLREVAEELGPADRLQDGDRQLALRLEARIRFASSSDPAALASSLKRLQALGPEPVTGTVAERELMAALLFAASVTIGLQASQVAPLADRVLRDQQSSSSPSPFLHPLAMATLFAADSVAGPSDWLDTARRDAASREPGPELARALLEQAMVHLSCGRLREARTGALAAFEIARDDDSEVMVQTAGALAVVALQSRDAALTDRLLAVGWAVPEDSYAAALLAMLRAAAAANRNELHAALEHTLGAGHRLEQQGWRNPAFVSWISRAVLVYRRLGDRDRADELSLLELERARAWGGAATLGRALTVRGQVVEGPAGTDLLREAVDVLETSANRFELSRALLTLGERLRPTMAEEAQALLGRAHRLATECGATWVTVRTRGQLGEQLSVPPARPELTSTELKVAEFASAGCTNQEIADTLGVSRRAVEKHLTHCYRKLSCEGRAALATALSALLGKPAGGEEQLR